MKWSLVVAALSVASWVPLPARAQVTLDWQAPPECPQLDEIRERVRRLTGKSLEEGAPMTAEARITRNTSEYRLTLRVFDGPEVRERVIESESCADLAGAAAVTLVFLHQDVEQAREDDPPPASTESSAEPTPPTEASTPPKTTPPDPEYSTSGLPIDPPDEPPEPEEVGPSRWNVLLRGPILALDIGPLPEPTVSFGLGAGVRYDSYRLVVEGTWALPQKVEAEVPNVGVDVQRGSAALSLCRGWMFSRLEFSPCLGVALEHVSARGAGSAVESRSDGVFWLAPGAELTLHVHLLEWLAFYSGLSARVEAERPSLVLQELGELRRLSPFGAGAEIGLEWIP